MKIATVYIITDGGIEHPMITEDPSIAIFLKEKNIQANNGAVGYIEGDINISCLGIDILLNKFNYTNMIISTKTGEKIVNRYGFPTEHGSLYIIKVMRTNGSFYYKHGFVEEDKYSWNTTSLREDLLTVYKKGSTIDTGDMQILRKLLFE